MKRFLALVVGTLILAPSVSFACKIKPIVSVSGPRVYVRLVAHDPPPPHGEVHVVGFDVTYPGEFDSFGGVTVEDKGLWGSFSVINLGGRVRIGAWRSKESPLIQDGEVLATLGFSCQGGQNSFLATTYTDDLMSCADGVGSGECSKVE